MKTSSQNGLHIVYNLQRRIRKLHFRLFPTHFCYLDKVNGQRPHSYRETRKCNHHGNNDGAHVDIWLFPVDTLQCDVSISNAVALHYFQRVSGRDTNNNNTKVHISHSL